MDRSFSKNGFVVVPKLLSQDEILDLKEKLRRLSGLSDANFQPKRIYFRRDGITELPDFSSLIFHQRVLKHVREILGPGVKYLQGGDIQVHMGNWNWHRDLPGEVGEGLEEWKPSMVRVALYLHEYSTTSSSLGVIPGSHIFGQLKWVERELRFWNRLSNRLFQHRLTRRLVPTGLLPQPMFTSRPTMIKTEPGDCVIFDPKVIHSGTPIVGPTYKLLMSYGNQTKSAQAHYDYFRTKTDYCHEIPEELRERLAQQDLLPERAARFGS